MNSINFVNKDEFIESRDNKLGKYIETRTISEHIKNGFINLDKPAGPTSHEVVSIVKKILDIEKAGHSGTLDPQVTGVLPIGLLNSTKILSTLLLSPKKYICNMFMHGTHDIKEIKDIFAYYNGTIYQVPPLKSNVVKQLRMRKVYDISFLEKNQQNVLFAVESQAGTYIRTLCKDIGRSLGSFAYMKELRRIQTGPFSEYNVVSLHQLFDAWSDFKEEKNEEKIRQVIVPVEIAVTHLPLVYVRDSAIRSVCHGIDLKIPGILGYEKFDANQIVRLLTAKGELIGIGKGIQSSKIIKTQKSGLIIHPHKIIMDRNHYPLK